ncbi:hypothetical protein PCANC_11456 [Puccinia coronata f. sp. avenae]|uniref:Uncharacterized protein n=1 Tax=Puccinia coronata f. sp. avenae TaxID=200324 RepID=A0A2N5VCK8_9BASI|nr:hypothetical protein PCANC_11456 [Puccinia coronata f. sp. avenae]
MSDIIDDSSMNSIDWLVELSEHRGFLKEKFKNQDFAEENETSVTDQTTTTLANETKTTRRT